MSDRVPLSLSVLAIPTLAALASYELQRLQHAPLSCVHCLAGGPGEAWPRDATLRPVDACPGCGFETTYGKDYDRILAAYEDLQRAQSAALDLETAAPGAPVTRWTARDLTAEELAHLRAVAGLTSHALEEVSRLVTEQREAFARIAPYIDGGFIPPRELYDQVDANTRNVSEAVDALYQALTEQREARGV